MQSAATRVGILGGTFNPIHNGHIELAQRAKEKLELNRLLLIPTGDSPHKEAPEVGAVQRYEMACCAAADRGLEVSTLEIDRPGKSYTVDTLRALHQQYSNVEWFVVVGSDMLRDIQNWREPAELLRLATFVGVTRHGQSGREEDAVKQLRQAYDADVSLVELQIPAVSSSDIRRRVAAALPISGLVPAAVEAYIYENGLYMPREEREHLMLLKTMLPPERFAHTAGTMREAVALSAQYGGNGRTARLAALLHDCARGQKNGALTHAELGARMANEVFRVQDEAILQAIRLHTTLASGATHLDKIVYLADAIEPGREYEGVEELREIAKSSLDAAICACLQDTIDHVRARGKVVHPNSLAALDEIQSNMRKNMI